MRAEIFPMYYIHKEGKVIQVDKSHMLEEFKKYYSNAEEVLEDLEINDKIVSEGNVVFSVRRKK